MQRSASRDTKIIDDFRNLNQVVDEVMLSDDQSPWARGGHFDERLDFVRIPGKLPHTSATTGGHVLTLAQLSFVNGDVVLIHQDNEYKTESDVSCLTELTAGIAGSPLEPFIF